MPTHRRFRAPLLLPMALLALTFNSCSTSEPEVLEVGGLKERVEILRDKWGVSHIYAQNEQDLFFAQGYNVARDRLFQLELWRRQATGTLAEIQGERALPHDVGARLLRFRGDMADELGRYHPRGAAIVGSFVEGINAYIAATERDASLLPIEFEVLGIKPGKWTEEVVVSRHNGLFRNVTAEVQAARLVKILGEDKARELLHLHPGKPDLTADPAIDLASIRENLLSLYKASRTAIQFRPEDVKPEFRAEPMAFLDDTQSPMFDQPEMQGSNNWVVTGSRTASGKPIMANDPHRTIDLPSLRYWVHLNAPGWDVIGGGEPALPGVSIGHNPKGAWGFTIFPIDQEDLYVYETDPFNPDRYRYLDGWESMRIERESIAVKGKGRAQVPLKFTRHGPVIFEDKAGHQAYAVRAAWLEPGTAPYLASLRVDQASNWAEFVEGCKSFRTPSENLVWADVDGNIGWQAVGLSPIRKGWDGLLPVPGDGRFEWTGFVSPADLPFELNPSRGYFASANQDNLPPGFGPKVGFQWSEPFRFQRISEVLADSKQVSLDDMRKLQLDELSLQARALVPMLLKLKPSDDRASRAIERLKTWDFVLDKDSVAASIEVLWERALKVAVWERMVPKEARDAFPVRSLSPELMISLLAKPDARFGPDPAAGRDALMLGALDRALGDLEKRLGPDMNRWQFGQDRLKHVWMPHPLSEAVEPQPPSSPRHSLSSSRRLGAHGQQYVRLGKPGHRSLVPGDRRHQRMGPLDRHQHARPVRRSRQPPLQGSLRPLDRRRLFSRGLFESEGRSRDRGEDLAEPSDQEVNRGTKPSEPRNDTEETRKNEFVLILFRVSSVSFRGSIFPR